MAKTVSRVFRIGEGDVLLHLYKTFLNGNALSFGLPADKTQAVALNLAQSAYRLGSQDSQMRMLSCTTSDWAGCSRFFSGSPAFARVGDKLYVELTVADNNNVTFESLLIPRTEVLPNIQIGSVYDFDGEQLRVTGLSYDQKYGWLADVELPNGDAYGADSVALGSL